MNGAGLGSKYLVEAGKTVQTATCSFCGSSCSRHGSIAPCPLLASPRCFEYHSRIWSRLADLKKTPPIPRMRPRCSILTGGFDFSGCGDCTSCPPFKQAEMSNSEPSAIVPQGIPCMRGLYTSFDSDGESGSLRFTPSRSRMRSRTGLASPVENQACGIAKYPRLRVHRHEARMTPAKRRRHPQNRAILVALLAVA